MKFNLKINRSVKKLRQEYRAAVRSKLWVTATTTTHFTINFFFGDFQVKYSSAANLYASCSKDGSIKVSTLKFNGGCK